MKSSLITFSICTFSNKHCKYFKRGNGECPFNNNCFYLHANPDGSKAYAKPTVRRRRQNADGDLDFMGHFNLWDFLEERESERSLLLMELEANLESLLFDLMLGYDSDSDMDDF